MHIKHNPKPINIQCGFHEVNLWWQNAMVQHSFAFYHHQAHFRISKFQDSPGYFYNFTLCKLNKKSLSNLLGFMYKSVFEWNPGMHSHSNEISSDLNCKNLTIMHSFTSTTQFLHKKINFLYIYTYTIS